MSTKTINADKVIMALDGNEVFHQEDVELTISYTEEDNTEPKSIKTLEEAARYAYGLSDTREKIEEIERISKLEIERWEQKIKEVNSWKEKVLDPLKGKEEYLSFLLRQFHIDQYENASSDKEKAKLKSIKLPYGVTLASRESADQLVVTDDDALLQYAKDNGMVTVPEPKARWADIKKSLKANESGAVVDGNGEVLPFISVTKSERKFEVK